MKPGSRVTRPVSLSSELIRTPSLPSLAGTLSNSMRWSSTWNVAGVRAGSDIGVASLDQGPGTVSRSPLAPSRAEAPRSEERRVGKGHGHGEGTHQPERTTAQGREETKAWQG